MKTKRIITGFLALITVFFMTSFTSIKSDPPVKKAPPCPYMLVNKLQCPVRVSVRIFDVDPTGVCGPICNVIPSITIPPFSSIPIPCGGCVQICNIQVQIMSIGGTPVGAPFADFSNGFIPLPPICGANFYGFDSTIPGFVIF